MLIMKFQIDYLVSIRSMREDIFFLMTKFWYLWWNYFSFSISTIRLDGYPWTFKIWWVYPSHSLNSIKNLKEEILRFRFRVVSFNESITTNRTTRQVYQRANRFRELWKRWVTDQVGDRRAQIAEYLKRLQSKIPKGTNQNDPHNHEHNPIHNV